MLTYVFVNRCKRTYYKNLLLEVAHSLFKCQNIRNGGVSKSSWLGPP